MNTSKKEFLSALLDDEVGQFEQHRLLDELQRDTDLSSALSRYALIGETLRAKTALAVVRPDFLASLNAQLADEPSYDQVLVAINTANTASPATVSVPVKQTSQPAKRKVASWRYAMAASVLVAVVGSMWLWQAPSVVLDTDPSAAATAMIAPAAAPAVLDKETNALAAAAIPMAVERLPVESLPLVTASMPARASQQALDAHTRDILKQYVAQHVRYASANTIVPSVRAVAYSNDY